MKNFKKLIKEAYLGNPLNEDIQPLPVKKLSNEALLDMLNNINNMEGRKMTRAQYDLAKSVKAEVRRRGLEESVNEVDSLNDPALMKARAAQMKRDEMDKEEAEYKAKQAALNKKYGSSFMDKLDAELDLKAELEDLNHEREMIMIDMEEEAEPEGGPIADRYGERLNQIDQRIADIQEELDDLRMYESVNEESEGDKEIKALEKEAEKYSKTDSRYMQIQKKIGNLKSDKDYALPGSKADKKFSDMNEDRFKKNEDSYIRITEPRFNQDPVNPNFLFVRINYDTGPGVGMALGKETMAGQIRRLSSAEAVRQLENIGRKLSDSFDLEDLEIVDLENGVVELFAVSDDFIDMDPRSELSTAMLNENMGEWPKELTSRYSDEYRFELEKVSPTYKDKPGRAKYRVIDIESGELKGTPVFGTPESLMAYADDLIKPQGGRQSSHFGTNEGTCGYTPDGEPRSKPASPDLNEMEDEMLFLDKLRKGHAEESVNLEDFMKTMKTMYGKAAGSDDELEAAYERFRITRPDLEEASDTDVGGGAKPNDGEEDIKLSSDAALDNEVEKMGYNESKGFDFNKMVKEALTPKNLR